MREDTATVNQAPEPPAAPGMSRALRLRPGQLAGVALLALLPALALFGVFDARTRTDSAASGPVTLQVSFPTQLRYRMPGRIEASLHNAGTLPAPVTLDLERAYLRTAAVPTFTPGPEEVSPEAYRLASGSLAAGEQRSFLIDFEAGGYGRHAGAVLLDSGAGPVRLGFSTWVYP